MIMISDINVRWPSDHLDFHLKMIQKFLIVLTTGGA